MLVQTLRRVPAMSLRLRYPVLAFLLLGLAACGGDDGDPAVLAEPPLESTVEARDAALNCTDFSNPDKPPVLLVHGTFTSGTEQYTAFYTPCLLYTSPSPRDLSTSRMPSSA